MKKFLAFLLTLCMVMSLVACGSKDTEQTPDNAETPDAPEEQTISGPLVICSSATDLDLEAIQVGFNELYPDVEIEFVTCSAGEGIARVQAEGGNPTIDVFYSGLNQADGDKYADVFEPYVSVHDSEMPEQYRSNNGFYNYDHLSSTVLCVNTDLEKELGIEINGYADLMNSPTGDRTVNRVGPFHSEL